MKIIKTNINIILCLPILLAIFSCSTYAPSNAPSKTSENPYISEEAEFAALIKKDSITRKSRAVTAINLLLNPNPRDTIASLLINNNSNCNIIIRFYGSKDYNLPILKNNKNYLIVDKGYYILSTKFCNSTYKNNLEVTDSMEFTISENNNSQKN